MIDAEGFRPNVGIIICNQKGQVMWAKRIGQDAWQFPQGGIRHGERLQQAMFRELKEEVGLEARDVEILSSTRTISGKTPIPCVLAKNKSGFCWA